MFRWSVRKWRAHRCPSDQFGWLPVFWALMVYGGVVALIAASQLVLLLGVNWTASQSHALVARICRTGRIATPSGRAWPFRSQRDSGARAKPLWRPLLSKVLHLHQLRLGRVGLVFDQRLVASCAAALQGVKLLAYKAGY